MTATRLAPLGLIVTLVAVGCGEPRATGVDLGTVTLPGGAADGSDVTVRAEFCVACHGDAARSPAVGDAAGVAFAPPVDVSRAGTGAKVGTHLAHLQRGNLRDGVNCSTCHVVPQNAGQHTPGVTLRGLARPRTGAAVFNAGVGGAAGTCSATYCHGNFSGGVGSVTVNWNSGTVSCGTSCHQLPPPNAAHAGQTYPADCVTCHGGTVDAGGAILVAGGLHINGTVEGGESSGNVACGGCHATIFAGMTDAGATSRHALTLDDPALQTTISWGDPLSNNGAAVRSCTNMCHDDHPHTAGGASDHSYDLYADANQRASAPSTTTLARTDFDGGAANGGACVSCHRFASANTSAFDKAAFDASAHDFNAAAGSSWRYLLHLGSFVRNCTKCHASATEGRTPNADATGSDAVAVHFNTNPTLLAGTTAPIGAGNVCYNCHGNAAPVDGQQGNRSGKNIQGQFAKANSHAAVPGGCLDCHDPHEAKAGTHATPGNKAGPPLEGIDGARLQTYPAFWSAPAAGNFNAVSIVAGVEAEATLCFKCHSAFATALPAGTTDVAKEFNPNNVGNYATTGTASWQANETAGGFHPVLATAGGNLGAVRLSNLSAPWNVARNLMTCTDCHESETTTDPNGPHGSTAAFLLKGPNTAWSNAIIVGDANQGTAFCWNCHDSAFANSRFPGHDNGDHNIRCMNCHAAIPHGGPRPGMLVAPSGTSGNVPTPPGTWDTGAPYSTPGAGNTLYINSYPTSNSTGTDWTKGNCGCNGASHG